jgi:hypothetical protein
VPEYYTAPKVAATISRDQGFFAVSAGGSNVLSKTFSLRVAPWRGRPEAEGEPSVLESTYEGAMYENFEWSLLIALEYEVPICPYFPAGSNRYYYGNRHYVYRLMTPREVLICHAITFGSVEPVEEVPGSPESRYLRLTIDEPIIQCFKWTPGKVVEAVPDEYLAAGFNSLTTGVVETPHPGNPTGTPWIKEPDWTGVPGIGRDAIYGIRYSRSMV